MKKLRDQKHAEMLKAYVGWYIKTFKEPKSGHDVELEIEVPFNYYGDRGFIDLLAKRTIPLHDFLDGNWKIVGKDIYYDICELKTRIEDLGETIRQIKRAKEFFPLTRRLLKNHCFEWLVILDTPENRRCVRDNEELLKTAGIETRFFNPSSGNIEIAYWDLTIRRITALEGASG